MNLFVSQFKVYGFIAFDIKIYFIEISHSLLYASLYIITRIEAGVLLGLEHDAGVQVTNHEVPQEYYISEPAHLHEVQTIVKQFEVILYSEKMLYLILRNEMVDVLRFHFLLKNIYKSCCTCSRGSYCTCKLSI